MHDLFVPAIASRLRIHRPLGDNMEPTIRSTMDYLLIAPVSTYRGEGIYVSDDDGAFRCQRGPRQGTLWLLSDNRTYQKQRVACEWSDEHVTGKVAALIKTQDHFLLEGRDPPGMEPVRSF
jgi:phage repressor protein C with HTH and peptisase S24 domain